MALVTPAELASAIGVGSLYTDEQLEEYCDAAAAVIEPLVTAASFTAEPVAMRKAALALAIDIFQSERAPGGTPVGVDFTPSPFRMGRNLTTKVTGLLAPYLDTDAMVG